MLVHKKGTPRTEAFLFYLLIVYLLLAHIFAVLNNG